MIHTPLFTQQIFYHVPSQAPFSNKCSSINQIIPEYQFHKLGQGISAYRIPHTSTTTHILLQSAL